MFQNVRQKSPFYILDKGEKPSLQIAMVESVTSPAPRYATTYPMQSFGNTECVVDIVVMLGDEKREYKQLPANLSIANFGTSGIVVSDDKAAMCAEVEAYMNNSRKVIESIPYHNIVVEESQKMLLQLNPQLAKDKEKEDRINALEGKVSNMSDTLGKMMGMLSDALETKLKTQKGD